MDAQMKRGLLEACVLSLLLKGDSYGYLLIQEVSALMPISESTLYPVLRRLEILCHYRKRKSPDPILPERMGRCKPRIYLYPDRYHQGGKYP